MMPTTHGPLDLVPTQALIEALNSRFDVSVFAGLTRKDGTFQESKCFYGDHHSVLGLLARAEFFVNQRLTQDAQP